MADDYISRQDAIIEMMDNDVDHAQGTDGREVVQILEGIPAADVVQVVRCRKCQYFWTYRCMDSMPIETCELAQTFYNPDLDFCSLAKRREE